MLVALLKVGTKPCEVTFIKLASYEGVKSTEDIQRLVV
jgi:adenylate kinase